MEHGAWNNCGDFCRDAINRVSAKFPNRNEINYVVQVANLNLRGVMNHLDNFQASGFNF